MAVSSSSGAVAILEFARSRGIDCLFSSPIAVLAPLWEALAARAERGGADMPRYFNCRHELLAVALASGYYKATGKLAEAYGGHGERVRPADELAPALTRALRAVQDGRLALLDVFTYP